MLKIYDSSPEFYDRFMHESDKLASILGRNCAVEHIGSTSVPGLIGKGIIDIAIGFDNIKQIEVASGRLLGDGYFASRSKITKPDYVFLASTDADTTLGDFHLHLVLKKGQYFVDFIKFRDILRANPDIAEKYAKLKQKIAKKVGGNRDEYTKQKGVFIKKVLRSSGGKRQLWHLSH